MDEFGNCEMIENGERERERESGREEMKYADENVVMYAILTRN